MVIIGIHGKAGVGKDTAALYMMRADNEFHSYAFADPMRAIASHLYNVPVAFFTTASGKATYNHYWNKTHRVMLQELGQAIREMLGEDHWIKLLIDRVTTSETRKSKIIIKDVRHQNELDFILDAGGHVIHIESSKLAAINPDSKEASHVSEQALDMSRAKEYNRYYPILNDGTKQEFEQDVLAVLSLITPKGDNSTPSN